MTTVHVVTMILSGEPNEMGPDPREWLLSDVGHKHVGQRAPHICGKHPSFDRVLCAPTKSAQQTAVALSGLLDTDQKFMTSGVLFPDEGTAADSELKVMCDQLGSAPLADYFKLPNESTLRILAASAAREILWQINQGRTQILVVGYGILVPATVAAIFALAGFSDPDGYETKFKLTTFRWCDGLRLQVERDGRGFLKLKTLTLV